LHTLTQPIESDRVRLTARTVQPAARFRFELYTDCLYATDFEADLGRGYNGTTVVALVGGKDINVAANGGLAMVVNTPFRSVDRSALVVRNSPANLELPDITVPATVGRCACSACPSMALMLLSAFRIRVMLSVASNGREGQNDSIALFQQRGSASNLQTLQSGAVNQEADEFRVGACAAMVNGGTCSCCCVDHHHIH